MELEKKREEKEITQERFFFFGRSIGKLLLMLSYYGPKLNWFQVRIT